MPPLHLERTERKRKRSSEIKAKCGKHECSIPEKLKWPRILQQKHAILEVCVKRQVQSEVGQRQEASFLATF